MVTMKRILGATVCGLTLLASAVHAEQRELRVYNWADYILPSVPKDFAAKTGIKVTWTPSTPTNRWKPSCSPATPVTTWWCRRTSSSKPRSRPGCSELDKSKLPNWSHQDPALLKLLDANDLATSTACPTCTAPC
jgi:putrescine transport system substrate-binding protein